ncbi:alpha-2-macroglobulin family protein [Rhodovarius lipocyclicus]|uniref:alpha-2-macroglobulin family protein n=1 Tax=Rhodovarius lipocyclicus TaxID=268410 RepID=UPI00135C8D00|nr:alpha-2-macroglobulin [Rhodovarius lipocyclicus]
MRRFAMAILLAGLALAGFLPLAGALAQQPPELPGLANDSERYQADLARRFPAGGTPQQRTAAENRATAAERASNWPNAAAAWEERIGMGDFRPEHAMGLARAQLARTPPENARALQAAWLAFMLVPAGPPEIPSLLLMADALRRLDRVPEQLRVLQAVVERAPRDQRYRTMLADATRAAGLLVRSVTLNAEAEPPTACIAFTAPLSERNDWRPADWLRAEPALPDIAVTREGQTLCVAGLPHGRQTRLVLRAGLPGAQDLRLARDTPVPVSMPNRAPRIGFDASRFILPRGQQARVGVGTVNLSALHLRVLRVGERALVPAQRYQTGLADLDSYEVDAMAENHGRVIWEGRAELPALVPNTTQRVVLPLPEVLRGAGPGLYLLMARPGDGSSRDVSAGLPVFVTDLGLTAWRSPQGLAVQARGLQSGRPLPGVKLSLLARNNDVLAEAESDADGVVRFAAPLLRGTGAAAPMGVHGALGDDLVALSLDAASFDLSDRGASGRAHPGPLDVFIYSERGIYRPGEVIQATALLRDAAGVPQDLPVRLRLRRPNGQVAAEAVPPREAGGAIFWSAPLPSGAPAGLWKLEAVTDPDLPPLASLDIRVDAFIPERLDVAIADPGPMTIGQPLQVPVTARFLYGAPAEGLGGSAEVSFTADRSPFPQWRGFEFGLTEEIFEPPFNSMPLPPTDAQGRTVLEVSLASLPDTTRPLTARIDISVEEPGGRATRGSVTVPVRPRGRLIGIRPVFQGGAVNEGQEAAFDILALNAELAPVAAPLGWRLLREVPEWRMTSGEGTPRYAITWRSEPVEAGRIETRAEPVRLARSLPFGRYRLEVQEPGGLGISSLRFRSGWAISLDAGEAPDKVDVASDRAAYAPGETARIRITPPFAGIASVAVLTDRLLSIRDVAVPAGGTEVEVPVDAAWGAGAHVAVTVFRPGETREGQPARALGLTWLQIDPASRALQVAIEGPERITPRQRITLPVRVAGAGGVAHLTLAAVDEGILRLTRFASPDPLAHFTGRRRLGVDIRDDYGRLIPPPEGNLATLRQGGDDMGDLGTIPIPQRNVVLFSGLVATNADGLAQVTLDVPDFAGELRLMAVAWAGSRVGSASRPLTVRDPVVAEAVLPRFLAPGDEARLPVLLHNLDLPAGEVTATLTAEGAIALVGETRVTASLANGARHRAAATLRATAPGEGVLRLAVTGPQGFSVTRESRIVIRSSRPIVTEVAGQEIPPGQDRPLALPAERFLAGWRASARFGGPVRYDVPGMLRALEAFPLDCTEQAGSRVLGLASVGEWGGEDRAARLQTAVNSVLNRQRYDGAFALWSAQGEGRPWLTAYATEALLRARAAGAAVPDAALNAVLQNLEEALEDAFEENPEGFATQAYRLHALAMGGRVRLGAARRLLERLEDLPTPLARAQLGATFARGGDVARAEVAFNAALAAPARRFWLADYGSAARDAMAVTVLLAESGVLPARLAEARSRLPGAEFRPDGTSTQERGWALLAAQVLGRDGRTPAIALNGAAQPASGPVLTVPLTGAATARNTGGAPVWAAVSITGIPAAPQPAARNGLRVARRFFALDGTALNLDTLRSGTDFIIQIEARAETGQAHDAMLQQGLPAGWELVTRLPAGDVPGMGWVGTLSEAVAAPALDDRLAAAISLSQGEPLARLAWRVRATTPGRYELPGADVSDMYRPEFFARQNTGRVVVGD